jgi:hypothetical protein
MNMMNDMKLVKKHETNFVAKSRTGETIKAGVFNKKCPGNTANKTEKNKFETSL